MENINITIQEKILKYKSISQQVRIDCLKMISQAKAGHPGSSFSCVDLIVVIFYDWMKRDIHNALLENRDKFILSKGHAVPVLYSLFSLIGLIKREDLSSFRQLNSKLQGHPDVTKLPYLEASTGSLGQGLSIAQGMAIAHKLNQYKSRVYCLIGDGEIQEGQIWEAFMSASKMKLDNLTAILDYNNFQIDGKISDVMPIEPIRKKLEAFGWKVFEINGHDIPSIIDLKIELYKVKDQPQFVIAKTIKGKGVSFMENQVDWHGKAPNLEETELALNELSSLI